MELAEMVLLISLGMLLPSAIFAVMYLKMRRPAEAEGDKKWIYACGEHWELERMAVSPQSLFWAVWRKVFVKLYTALIEKVHSGVPSDWLIYMIIILALAVLALSIAVTGGGG